MEAKIVVQMDNAAFDGNAGQELARILEELAEELKTYPQVFAGHAWRLKDINGNVVGRFEISYSIVEHEELIDVVDELLTLADEGAYIDLADIKSTPISRRLRDALEAAKQ